MLVGLDCDDVDVALRRMGISDDQDEGEEDNSDVVSEFSEDKSDETESEDGDIEAEDASPEFPEKLPLMLPSYFDREDIVSAKLEGLSSQELELRKGQANDCLEKLRLTLGHQAMLYRTKIRKASGTKQRLRGWDDVKASRRQVEVWFRGYKRARNALERLGADEETMSTYQVISRSDLRLSGDITQENRLGQRDDTLAWFWRPEDGVVDGSSLMDECEVCIFLIGLSLTIKT